MTGRVGLWTATREARPRPTIPRRLLPADEGRCPFCAPAADDPRLLVGEADRGAGRWFAMRNLYPPLEGRTGRASLAVAPDHSPTLSHLRPDLAEVWATQLEVQRQLARRAGTGWTLLTTAVGVSAGASQHHPHGQVLTATSAPPLAVTHQQRWAEAATVDAVLADELTVAAVDGVRLLAPLVPLGPLDLWMVPTPPVGLDALDIEAAASLISQWLHAVHAQLRPSASTLAAPVDIKTMLYPSLPDRTGRWWAELQVTERHAPGVAAAPLVDVVDPPERHAERFRSAGRPA